MSSRGASASTLSKRNNFAYLLRSLRQRQGLTAAQLSRAALVDHSYITRLETGQRKGCSRTVALALAEGLNLNHKETNNLLIATGHAPTTIGPQVKITSAVLAVSALESEPTMTAESRQAFEQVIINICNHWRSLPDVS
jgi:transcriptional regulator with XRE-family HTH domain